LTDFKMAKKQKPNFMRIPKEVLRELEGCKIAKRESYADVVRRLLNEKRLRKL